MVIPPSSPFQKPFGDDLTPQELVKYLNSILVDVLTPGILIKGDGREEIFNLLRDLCCIMMGDFPKPRTAKWKMLRERVEIVQVSLQLVDRALLCVEGIVGGDEGIERIILAQLLNFSCILEAWIMSNTPDGDLGDVTSPQELKLQLELVALNMLSVLAGTHKSNLGERRLRPAYESLRRCLDECVALATDLSARHFTTPLGIMLFGDPRIIDPPHEENQDVSRSYIVIQDVAAFDILITDSISLIAQLATSASIHAVATDALKRITEVASGYLGELLNEGNHMPIPRRTRALVLLLKGINPLFSATTFDPRVLPPYLCKLVIKRLLDGQQPVWDEVDEYLIRVLERLPSGTRLGVESAWFQEVLTTRYSKDEDDCKLRDMIFVCLRISVPLINPERLLLLEDALSTCPPCEKSDVLLSSVKQYRACAVNDPIGNSLGKRKREASSWRDVARDAIVKCLYAGDPTAFSDIEELNAAEWCRMIMERLHKHVTDTVDISLPELDIERVTEIMKIPCLLSHGDSDCTRDSFLSGLALVPTFTTVSLRLLDTHGKNVMANLRRIVFEILRQSVKHHSQGLAGTHLERLLAVIKRGMQMSERAVRLAAGRVLSELFLMYRHSSRGSTQRFEPLFRMINELMYTEKLGVIEVVLITLGDVGRSAQDDILGKILHHIIAQLGHKNPVIKGLAYTQLLDITNRHKKTPYGLLAPYIFPLSTFLVSSVATNPERFLQTCNFLDMSPSKFYNLTIGHFLPHLVCTRNSDALNKVGRELRISPVSLITSHDVLAHVFLLRGPGETDKAFEFILDLLMKSRTDANDRITVLMLVKSTVVPLLGEIVICMGDEDTTLQQQALSAIEKVEKVLEPERRHRRSQLLQEYVMGIVSHLNEVLQDAHGKRPLSIKRKVMRSLGVLIKRVGTQITTVAPQVMAIMQSMLPMPALAEETLFSWHTFITALDVADIGPYIGPTSAAFVIAWPDLKDTGRALVRQAFEYLLITNAESIGKAIDAVVALDSIPELAPYAAHLQALRSNKSPVEQLESLLDRVASDNVTVCELSLLELRDFMARNQQYILKLASGDAFDPIISKLVMSLWDTACRDGENLEGLQLLAYDCIGRLGAVDPDRLELATKDTTMILYQNYGDEEESIRFALYLITDILVGTFRSTSDIRFQSHLAFAIQELLKFCGFTEQLVSAQSNAIPLKTRSRWSSLPPHVLEACAPLLQAKYTNTEMPSRIVSHPIYPSKSTYREWMQDWTAHLIDRVSLPRAKAIFNVFRPVVIDKDVGVARHILPHLVLHILISGTEADAHNLDMEITAVLKDQVEPAANSSRDRRLLCAQTIFMLMDHLNKWVRAVRQDLVNRRAELKRTRLPELLLETENNLVKVDSLLSNVNNELIAKAAFECRAYARSLMNFERQIQIREEKGVSRDDPELQAYYERLHEIYSHLDEPDGMEGITSKVLATSLEHQIRQHESTGRWTSAQSCWEVRLQQSPDNLEFHLGLLRCLRNLGHYDTLRTHIKGVLSRNPDWHDALSGFQAEGAWMVGDWDCVQELSQRDTPNPLPEIIVARVLLAMRDGHLEGVTKALSVARASLGAPIHAAGRHSYRRAYVSVLNLHLVRDVEMIYDVTVACGTQIKATSAPIRVLSDVLTRRFEATLPSFRSREPILSLQRTALGLSERHAKELKTVIGKAWLSTAKIARKAGHAQTAYSAMLQAIRADGPFSYIQSAKLVKATGEPIRALQELNNALSKPALTTSEPTEVISPNQEPDSETTKMKAKAQILRAQWMYDAERFEMDIIHKGFKEAVALAENWESAHFHLGKFYDQQFTRITMSEKEAYTGWDLNYQTVKCYAKTLQLGSKYVYQTMPRMLTLWLDLGEKAPASQETRNGAVNAEVFLHKANQKIHSAMRSVATYKWLTAFPQIVSRIDHSNRSVYEVLSNLIVRVLEEYPHQGLWLFMSVVQSKKPERNRRGDSIINKLTSNPHKSRRHVADIANQCRTMTDELLKLCNHVVTDDSKLSLSMAKLFPNLAKLAPSQLIVPLQESLIATLPSESSLEASHQPFPHRLPRIHRFDDGIEVMKSLAKPRKISLGADNGRTFAFLGKPKDDLRKDARLMDFNAMINKLLKTDSDARRRQLHIRTYSVITLNEECGLIEWVPNTVPMRPVLVRSYDLRNISIWGPKVNQAYIKLKELPVDQVAPFFAREILPLYPPVFHEWFIDTFPEPSAWLASRLSFARTAAVMSMVGFILGLGDRHSENILLDVNSGDVIHVDFDCLFERGKRLETPERVPFRLTQNMQDGLGVINVDGPFRIACEITMGLLRRNKDCLMSVLDAFIHDPLVEWEDEKKRMEKQRKSAAYKKKGHGNVLKEEVDLRDLAKNALLPIQRKLQGIYTSGDRRDEWKEGKEMSTVNLVEALIQEAKSNKNLARMYPGWGPFL